MHSFAHIAKPLLFISLFSIPCRFVSADSQTAPTGARTAIAAAYAAQDLAVSRKDLASALAPYSNSWSAALRSGAGSLDLSDRRHMLSQLFSSGGSASEHTAILGMTGSGKAITVHVAQELKATGVHPLDRFCDDIYDEDRNDDWVMTAAGWRLVRSRQVKQDRRSLSRAADPEADRRWMQVEGLEPLQAVFGRVGEMRFSSDGRFLAIRTTPSGADLRSPWATEIWDVASRKQVTSLPDGDLYVYDMAFSPDGETLALAAGTEAFSANPQGTVTLLDTRTWKQKTRWQVKGTCMSSVAFSPDGRRLVGGCGNQQIVVWDIALGNRIKTIGTADRVDGLGASGLTYSAEGEIGCIISFNVSAWNATTFEPIPFPGQIATSLAWSPDGKTLAVGGSYADTPGGPYDRAGLIRFYDSNGTAKPFMDTWSYPDGQTDVVGWIPGGKTVVLRSIHSVVSWNLSGGLPVDLVTDVSVADVAINKEGTLLALTISERDPHVYLKKIALK